jgi:RIO kinase 1
VPSHNSSGSAASRYPSDEDPSRGEDRYDSYDEHLSDDFHAKERVRARSLLSEDEQKAEKRLLRRGRLTARERERLAERREDLLYAPSLPDGADRWSTWGDGELGPEPRPSWLVVADGAVDSRLGVVKTGKEADVHLVERWVPAASTPSTPPAPPTASDAFAGFTGWADLVGFAEGAGDLGLYGGAETDGNRDSYADRADPADAADPTPALTCLLAEKIYRSNEHRNFHRDAAYVDGRRTRESRMDRAVANRTRFGLKIIAEQWAVAEFAALATLWAAGAPVPYPVQRVGTELLLEFIGDADGTAAPRLAALRPSAAELGDLWGQLCAALEITARAGYTHGDLSPWNVLVHRGRLVLIDLPQIVDLTVNPRGDEYLSRDVRNVAGWFAARGLPDAERRGEQLLDTLRAEARLI